MIPGRYTFRFAKQIEDVEEKKKVLLKKKAEETEAFRLDCIVFRDHRDMEPESTFIWRLLFGFEGSALKP